MIKAIAFFFGLAVVTTVPAVSAEVDASTCNGNKMWLDAYNTGDAAKIAAMYAPDAIEVTTTGIRVGPAAAKEGAEEDMKHGLKYIDITSSKCNIEGDLRISAGDWKAEAPQQGPISGFWTAIERKDGD